MILDQIVAHKKEELQFDQVQVSLAELQSRVVDLPPTRDFEVALGQSNSSQISLIAEIKKKSPSKGIIRHNFDPVNIATIYAENGASAISVLTDNHFFAGQLSYLQQVRQAVELPLLRKDFTIDAYHLYQSRVAGADAILLIVAVLSEKQIGEYLDLSSQLGLAALVEVHTESELDLALKAEAKIIGINNRDLTVFQTKLTTTFRLLKQLPDPHDKIIVSESGIHTRDNVLKLQSARVDAILVGESLMRSEDIGSKVKELLGDSLPLS